MKLKIILTILILALIISGGYGFYLYAWDPSEKVSVNEDELTNAGFLKDKRAVLFFSTTADQDSNDGGTSYAMFVDEKGQANSIKMDGLELGNITKSTSQVFIEDKNRIQLIGEKYKTVHFKKVSIQENVLAIYQVKIYSLAFIIQDLIKRADMIPMFDMEMQMDLKQVLYLVTLCLLV
ncbi:hypothetical protein AB1282_07655 [Gottfriedia sp. S16(2024)]|uniref:hypothetical protein n=1 Tax=Gottfriedia sp. S16(2024) TaxID=3162883 RepID=UPI003D1A301E